MFSLRVHESPAPVMRSSQGRLSPFSVARVWFALTLVRTMGASRCKQIRIVMVSGMVIVPGGLGPLAGLEFHG